MREKLEQIAEKSKERIEQIKNSQELNDLKNIIFLSFGFTLINELDYAIF